MEEVLDSFPTARVNTFTSFIGYIKGRLFGNNLLSQNVQLRDVAFALLHVHALIARTCRPDSKT